MKKWDAEHIYVDSNNTGKLIDRLNRFEREGWIIEGCDILDKYHVLIIAYKEIDEEEEERQQREERDRLINMGRGRSMGGGNRVG